MTTLRADVGTRAFAGLGGIWSRSIGWIDARAASGLWWPVLAAGVVLALVFWVRMQAVQPPGVGKPLMFACHQIEAVYECARLGAEGRAGLRAALHLDFGFLCGYGAVAMAAVMLAARGKRRTAFERSFGLHVAALQPVVMAGDALENTLLLRELAAFPTIDGVTPWLVAVCALIKFSGLAAAGTYLALCAFWSSWRHALSAGARGARWRTALRVIAVGVAVGVIGCAGFWLFATGGGVGVGLTAMLLLGVVLPVGLSVVPRWEVVVAPATEEPVVEDSAAAEGHGEAPVEAQGTPSTVELPVEPASTAHSARPVTMEVVRPWELPIIMVRVPAGTFRLGSPKGEEGRYDDEGPIDNVAVGVIQIGRFAVMRGTWRLVMRREPKAWQRDKPNHDDLPANYVSWFDALEFCNALSALEKLQPCYELTRDGDNVDAKWTRSADGYRLPTEAEWEYAARAGTTTPYPWSAGEAGLNEHAWWYSNSGGNVHAVGSKFANAWGLHDMIGNVWEWCWDAFASEADPAGRDGEARAGVARVLRGGSFIRGVPKVLRSAYRDGDVPTYAYGNYGFRCVRGPHPQHP